MIPDRPFKVGMVQINTSFSGLNYFPYSVGILEAYARHNAACPNNYEFLVPIYARLPVKNAVERLLCADLVAFSVYVWNEQISLAIARELRERKPEVVIVFGGPQVLDRPDEINLYLREHPFIDLATHGEGEKIFLAVLENAFKRQWENVPSVSYLTPSGRFVQQPRIPRIRDLSEVPSPYLGGVFDRLIAAHPSEKWIGMWETNRGCPFECTFCGWGGAVNAKVNQWDLERLLAEIDWFADHSVDYISCADANFGILHRDIEIARYVAKVKQERHCFPGGFSVQNTKNAQERAYTIQKILSDAGLNRGVVLSMQSLDPTTLRYIKRANIKLSDYEELQRRFREDGVETMSDLILGLPGETYDSFANGVSTLIDRGQHNRIQFNNLSVLPDAEMWDPNYREQFGMETVRSRIINIHGYRDDFDEVPEYQDLVIATASMPREDWIKTRTFAWMVGLLYFDKVLQVPIVVAHGISGISYRELLKLFALETPLLPETDFPILTKLRRFFVDKAQHIQQGGEEYCHSKQWLDIWWPADEYIMIELCTTGKLGEFYREALAAFDRLFAARSVTFNPAILQDAVRLNESLIKMPFVESDLTISFDWNVWEHYQAVMREETVPLCVGSYQHEIDRTSEQWASWEEWYREVVWFGNKRGAYLYGNKPVAQIAGHF